MAFYVGEGAARPHTAWSINVLTLRDERIREITSFLGAGHFAGFGLPAVCPGVLSTGDGGR